MSRLAPRSAWVIVAATALVAAFSLASGASRAVAATVIAPRAFPSPEAAATAFVEALRADDLKTMAAILGSSAQRLISSGDPVADNEERERFVKAYDEAHTLVADGNKMVIQVGKDEWPFPIPLVKTGSQWRFDAHAGQEELLARRIGKNELAAIQVALAIVDAQRDYWRRNPQNASILQYARKINSTQGQRDGLYWPGKPDEEPSPLGPLVAEAQRQGYVGQGTGGKPVPYHGYYFRLLTGQGPEAAGGAYDYLVRGQMIGGFALVAYPAQWGASGVMTFIVNHDGVVYEKNLGPKTAATADAMKLFNPDSTWKKVATP